VKADPVLGVDDRGGEEAADELSSDVARELAQREALAVGRDESEAERDLAQAACEVSPGRGRAAPRGRAAGDSSRRRADARQG
jgi:hypothetical protein